MLNGTDAVAPKKRADYKKALQKQLERLCPLEKLLVVDSEADALRLLQQIGSHKRRPVFQRDLRAHLLAEEAVFHQDADDVTTGTLQVDGFVRWQSLDVNGLVHIPGWGDFQMERIDVRRYAGQPLPLLVLYRPQVPSSTGF